MWHLQRCNQALHLKTWTNRSRKSRNQSQSERAQDHMLKLSMNMNLLSQQRKVKLHIEVWKAVFLNMLINYNLLYSFKHPNTAPQRKYKTLYCVLILTYFCASLSCLNAANIYFPVLHMGVMPFILLHQWAIHCAPFVQVFIFIRYENIVGHVEI